MTLPPATFTLRAVVGTSYAETVVDTLLWTNVPDARAQVLEQLLAFEGMRFASEPPTMTVTPAGAAGDEEDLARLARAVWERVHERLEDVEL
ncbi:hypothetical protein [Kitasatospora purpeofusca]|uniref:hypothetical protein n=1 Tax=Kitasatospora purpeofusca TaxID=67352 RepID=UPI0037F6A487